MMEKADLDAKSESIRIAINCWYKIMSNINAKKRSFNYLNDHTDEYIPNKKVLIVDLKIIWQIQSCFYCTLFILSCKTCAH